MLDSGLERFIPEKTWPVGKPLEAEMLAPAKALDRPTLVLVADEESLQWKTLNTLTYSVGLRVFADSDPLHPLWNNVKSSIKKAGLGSALLKATLMSHTDHSPFDSGVNLVTKAEAAELWIERCSREQFLELQENMAFDRGCKVTDSGNVPGSPQELLCESAVTTRGIYVLSSVCAVTCF
ncbi:unnamed protein product [Symbiodinium sp. CCMP2456]|nr:unnamed protein product [Symbiodinium sp. CCMP2456]